MKLRRRIGSVFLAFAMALSLIPSVAVSALAAPEDESITVTGDGPMTTADRAVDFYLYTTQLYKLVMLEDSAVDETTRITKVTLLLNEKHPARGTEIDFVREGETKAETDRFHLNVQNYGNTIEPDNIRGIRISYVYSNESGADVTVSPGALCLDSDIVYGPLGNENGVTYAFAFWMGPNDSTFWSKVLNTTLTVEGGKTYTYTATFGTDLIGPEDPTGEDPDNPGDGIPDKYQVVVKYVANKGGKITGKQVEVLTIYDADGHYSIVGDVTATSSQAAAFHNWDFSRWVAPNGGVADWNPILGQQTIENAEGGNTYVFTAHFCYDPYIPPVVNPDPDDPTPPVDPDKPQLNTEDHYAYIVGYEDGTVRPEGDITRAEVATIFFRLLTDESRNEYWSQTNDYTDVAAGDWYNNAVSTLSKAGILNGYEDGSFQPNGNITRAEFATIAARFFEATYEGEDLFPDIKDHWARDYINQAAHAGIVNGYPDETFRPQENITRAEAMTIVNRTLDRHPDADHFLDNMVTWPDNLESAWYYEQVQEATNSHEYIMKTDADKNPYEIWKEILPVRDWSELEKTWSEAHAG